MLSDEEFDQWCLRLEIPEPTKNSSKVSAHHLQYVVSRADSAT